MSGSASNIATTMRLLLQHGPSRGYYPEASKSILICKPADRPRAAALLSKFNFKFMDGSRYIGSFIGTEESLHEWLAPKIKAWTNHVKLLSRVAKRYPQTAFAALTKSLQNEWTYLQRVVPDVSAAFQPIENALAEDFIPALFGDKACPSRDLTQLPVRHAGLGIPNPVTSSDKHFTVSLAMTNQVTASIRNSSPLDAIGYGTVSAGILGQAKKSLDDQMAEQLDTILASASHSDARRMKQSQLTGAWLTATPSDDFGTALSATEFRDSIRIRHGFSPLGLPSHCDACPSARFTVGHALQCSKGGLIRARHEAVSAEWH